MVKLGDILFDKMLVTKTTSGGTPIEYHNIETQKTIVTDYESKIKDKRKIHSLSDKELSSILQALNIKYYKILNRAFMDFLKDIQGQVNKRANSEKSFVIALHQEEDKDIILVVVSGKQIEIALPKKHYNIPLSFFFSFGNNLVTMLSYSSHGGWTSEDH